jgi:hypothetical protein
MHASDALQDIIVKACYRRKVSFDAEAYEREKAVTRMNL